MRRVPVFTLASLVVLGLVAAPVFSATLFGTDTPDIRLAPGSSADQVFDLDDFFDSASAATINYKQDGSAVADGVVTIFGKATAGKSVVKFDATVGSETVSQDSVVQVNSFLISNIPGIDNNNRVAGLAGGNDFLVGIVPGASASSKENLVLVGGGDFGSLTGASSTGSASLIATIAEVKVSYASTGLVQRMAEVKAEGEGSATFGGLTATVKADGSYTLAAASTFSGPFVVTLGAAGAGSADAVHVVAAKKTAVAMESATFVGINAGSMTEKNATFANGAATFTLKKNEGKLYIANAGVAATGNVTVSMNYKTTSTGVSIAVVGFDAAGVTTINADKIAYNLMTGDVLEANVVKNIAVSANVAAGLLPAFQVVNPTDADATVTISDLCVIAAGPVNDYAINPNAEAALAPAGDLTTIAGVGTVNAAAAGSASTSNNFASPSGAGCLQLDATTAVANGLLVATVDEGSFACEAWVKKVSSLASGVFYLHVTNGVTEARQQISTNDMAADWVKVSSEGVAKAGALYVVVQAKDANLLVDDVTVRLLQDSKMFFDYELLGL